MKKQLILSTFLYFSIISLQDITAQDTQVQNQSQQENESGERKILTLKEIDKLIKEKEYNLAISELVSYMRKHPDDFDRAQKRIKKIMDIRNLYDERAEKLAEMMKEDSAASDDKTTTNSYTEEAKASDHEKLELILQLENHEKNQTETATELTRQARKALALRFYIDRYNRIMQEGHKLLTEEKYEDALAKFEEGFDLKKSDSDKIYTPEVPDGIPVVYEEDITEPVAEHLSNISEIAKGFTDLRKECEDAYKEFIQAVQKEDYQAAIRANEKVHSSYKKYAHLRNSIQKETNILRGIETSVVTKTSALAEINYISFTLGFIEGDKGYSETGILGIMDYFWNNTVEDMKEKLYALTYSNLKKIQNKLPKESIRESYSEIDSEIENARTVRNFSTFGGGLNDLHKEIVLADGTKFCNGFTEYNESMKFAGKFSKSMEDTLTGSKMLSDETLKKYTEDIGSGRFIATKEFLTSHLDAAVKYEEIMSQSKSEEYVKKELEKEKDFFRTKEILENKEKHTPFEVAKATEKFKGRKSAKTTAGTQVEDSVLDYRDAIEYQNEIAEMNFQESMGKSRELWGGLARLFATNAESTANDYSQLFSRAQELLNGIRSDSVNEGSGEENEEQESILRKYPREAKSLADKIETDITEKKENFKDWRKSFAKGEKYRGELKDYNEGTKTIDKSINELEVLLTKTKRLAAQAQAQVRKAEIALDEAKQNYARAVNELEKENFTQARNYLGMASQKYAESFNIQESMNEREESDRLIKELSERIVREENELVIREVRSLINDAQDLYYDGDLELAEKKLSQAQNRWSVTNTEKNEEIETLLELVSSARKLQIGRKIKPTDPLYSDMSQLLSVANQFYEDGEKLMKQGKSEEAKKSLNTAKEKLEPMKLIYPLNDDAAFLRLKIEKLLDPESFQAGFKKRIDDANKLKSAEKLATLETLLKINPSYPGLAKKVEDLQYELGFKTRPVAQTSSSAKNSSSDSQNQAAETQKRAENLYAQAQRIFQNAGNNQSELQRASSLLDEIIRMYSRDRRASIFRQATALKDRIQSRIGGTVVAVLTADDEANFQRAQNFVNKGNYDAANDILDALWKKAAARNSKKIIDLRAFVKNRL
ncbi:MAG: hypothetical protein IKN34_07930 [Treponema sp.]|nr:hypothetical protein [Treponema sp.]